MLACPHSLFIGVHLPFVSVNAAKVLLTYSPAYIIEKVALMLFIAEMFVAI